MIIHGYDNTANKSLQQQLKLIVDGVVGNTDEKPGFLWYGLYIRFLGKDAYEKLKQNKVGKKSIISMVEDQGKIQDMINYLVVKYEITGNSENERFSINFKELDDSIVENAIYYKFKLGRHFINLYDEVSSFNRRNYVKTPLYTSDERNKLDKEFNKFQVTYDKLMRTILSFAKKSDNNNNFVNDDFYSVNLNNNYNDEISRIVEIKNFFKDDSKNIVDDSQRINTFLYNIFCGKLQNIYKLERSEGIHEIIHKNIMKYLSNNESGITSYMSSRLNSIDYIISNYNIFKDIDIDIPVSSRKTRSIKLYSLFVQDDWSTFCGLHEYEFDKSSFVKNKEDIIGGNFSEINR